jgi:hypothetical protein
MLAEVEQYFFGHYARWGYAAGGLRRGRVTPRACDAAGDATCGALLGWLRSRTRNHPLVPTPPPPPLPISFEPQPLL